MFCSYYSPTIQAMNSLIKVGKKSLLTRKSIPTTHYTAYSKD